MIVNLPEPELGFIKWWENKGCQEHASNRMPHEVDVVEACNAAFVEGWVRRAWSRKAEANES